MQTPILYPESAGKECASKPAIPKDIQKGYPARE